MCKYVCIVDTCIFKIKIKKIKYLFNNKECRGYVHIEATGMRRSRDGAG